LIALAIWSLAIVAFFREAVTLRKALFYFDITEINFPYRDFLARELRAGRFSRWCPDLYCGMPLYSESQAGYLHPLKYLLYPWLSSWAAFNLDTILSIWLTGLGTYGWLRRHVGPSGALAGAAVFGLSGYAWAHLIHTSMINALPSVPFAFWALEWAWDGGRLRGIALGAVALACQVFAGHLQDAILTGSALGLYGLYRAAVEPGRSARASAFGSTLGMIALAVAISAVQWVPSKELIDRSPRAGGLSWDDMTFGSWHPALLPAVVVREAYGTRARDTDWMDGFYPYHEMNVYLGVVGLGLAAVGAAAYRDRWVGFWPLLALAGLLLMLGRYTFLLDYANKVPIFGSGRIPVRYHLWVSLAIAALAGVGVDRLARMGRVRLRGAALTVGILVVASLPILAFVYAPVWTEPDRWTEKSHRDRYRWLGEELTEATVRTAALATLAWVIARRASRADELGRRRRLAAALPALAILDLMGAHAHDVPLVDPSYWTTPPASADWLKARPDLVRIWGVARFHSGEPGFASEPGAVDFFGVRDCLAWSLPPVWGLRSTAGETPIIPIRRLRFTDHAGPERFDLEGMSYFLTGSRGTTLFGNPRAKLGRAYVFHNAGALPRARLVGRPVYSGGEAESVRALKALGLRSRDQVVVEDPDRPLPTGAIVEGTARIVREIPERIEVATDSAGPAYLVLADTFDPGWTAMVDGRPAPIRPAYVAFRAVFLPPGRHEVTFTYRPAGFLLGLGLSLAALACWLALVVWPGRALQPLGSGHGPSGWSPAWPRWAVLAAVAIVAVSAVGWDPKSGITLHSRWQGSFHRFTWGSGLEAMKPRVGPSR
jgi:hypothetical protein